MSRILANKPLRQIYDNKRHRKIAVIGAGPYGLSIAAWLRDRNVDFRIFGNPMHTWKTQMPTGMRLKSEGFASSFLFDPASAFTMERYCELNGIPYADNGLTGSAGNVRRVRDGISETNGSRTGREDGGPAGAFAHGIQARAQ